MIIFLVSGFILLLVLAALMFAISHFLKYIQRIMTLKNKVPETMLPDTPLSQDGMTQKSHNLDFLHPEAIDAISYN